MTWSDHPRRIVPTTIPLGTTSDRSPLSCAGRGPAGRHRGTFTTILERPINSRQIYACVRRPLDSKERPFSDWVHDRAQFIIPGPHRLHSVDAAYCYRRSGVVWVVWDHRRALQNSWTDRYTADTCRLRRHVLDGSVHFGAIRRIRLNDLCDGGDASCCYRYSSNLLDIITPKQQVLGLVLKFGFCRPLCAFINCIYLLTNLLNTKQGIQKLQW